MILLLFFELKCPSSSVTMGSVEIGVGDECMDDEKIVMIEQEDSSMIEEPLLGQVTFDEIIAELRLS